MKIFISVFAAAALSFAVCKSNELEKKPYNFQEIISSICDGSSRLNSMISQNTFDDVIRAIELLEKGDVTEADKTNEIIKEFIEAFKKECALKIEEVKKNENFYHNVWLLNFVAAGTFAFFSSHNNLPHFSNEFLERNVHSKDNHFYALIAWATSIFFLYYKAHGYQNERVALQDIEACVAQLIASLEA